MPVDVGSIERRVQCRVMVIASAGIDWVRVQPRVGDVGNDSNVDGGDTVRGGRDDCRDGDSEGEDLPLKVDRSFLLVFTDTVDSLELTLHTPRTPPQN